MNPFVKRGSSVRDPPAQESESVPVDPVTDDESARNRTSRFVRPDRGGVIGMMSISAGACLALLLSKSQPGFVLVGGVYCGLTIGLLWHIQELLQRIDGINGQIAELRRFRQPRKEARQPPGLIMVPPSAPSLEQLTASPGRSRVTPVQPKQKCAQPKPPVKVKQPKASKPQVLTGANTEPLGKKKIPGLTKRKAYEIAIAHIERSASLAEGVTRLDSVTTGTDADSLFGVNWGRLTPLDFTIPVEPVAEPLPEVFEASSGSNGLSPPLQVMAEEPGLCCYNTNAQG